MTSPINAQCVKNNADYVRTIHVATPAAGTKYEDILGAEYWKHVAVSFQPHSRIEVVPEDGTWFAELFIVSCGRNWANVLPLRHVELAAPAVTPETDPKYKVMWRGMTHKHCVVRVSDKEVIKTEFATAAEAAKWLEEYEATVA
jgi:hypothetical protein